MRRASLLRAACAVAVALLAPGAAVDAGGQVRDPALSFPSRPVRILVQGGPGSPPDYRARVLAGRPATDVAAELGMTTGAVRVAKCRVLQRLREELADFA